MKTATNYSKNLSSSRHFCIFFCPNPEASNLYSENNTRLISITTQSMRHNGSDMSHAWPTMKKKQPSFFMHLDNNCCYAGASLVINGDSWVSWHSQPAWPEIQDKTFYSSFIYKVLHIIIIIIIIIINPCSATLVMCLGLDACFYKINSCAQQWRDSESFSQPFFT